VPPDPQTADSILQTSASASAAASVRSALNPARTVLDSGAVLLTKPTHTTPAVAINLAMRTGSIADPPGLPGATWLLSRVIDRGTAMRSAGDIAEELDSRGITLTLTVTRHLLSLVCTCLADDFDAVLALLGEMLMSPSLPDEEITTRKGEVITAIRQDEDNPAVRASETLMALLYPGHPYGRRAKGSIEIVENLTRAQLLRLHADRFAPTELTAVVVGDAEPARVKDVAARVFGGWRKPVPVPIPLPPVRPASARQRVVIPMMNKAQADVAYGFTTITRRDPAYYAFWLMNVAFGQYAIGGRLGDSIRERQGMAYYVSSALDANVAEGPLAIRAGVSPANVDRAVASIDEEVVRLVRDGLTEKELDESRRYLIGSIPRALETNAAIAAFLQTEELFGLGVDYDARLPDLLGAVTLDDVNAAARRALDSDRATVVIAGPYEDRVIG
jgi:zinc protease